MFDTMKTRRMQENKHALRDKMCQTSRDNICAHAYYTFVAGVETDVQRQRSLGRPS